MKHFSPEKANALIPILAPIVEELFSKRRELAIELLENDPALHRGGSRTHDRRSARRFTDLKTEIVRLINKIESHGAVVKDLDLGLLDFPAVRDGRPVYLCWKAGEDHLGWWHGTDEGFGSRKPLDD
jgi:hypothetical protein